MLSGNHVTDIATEWHAGVVAVVAVKVEAGMGVLGHFAFDPLVEHLDYEDLTHVPLVL